VDVDVDVDVDADAEGTYFVYNSRYQGIERGLQRGEGVAKQHGKTFVITIKFSQITCNCLRWPKLGGVR